MFSAGDIKQINDLYFGNKIDLYTFTYGVAVDPTNCFVSTIGDKNKFITFLEKYFGDESGKWDRNNLFKQNYKIGNFLSQDGNTKAFLELLRSEDAGIVVMEPNFDFSSYSVLSLDENMKLVRAPCNL